jgi:hypothetical protein
MLAELIKNGFGEINKQPNRKTRFETRFVNKAGLIF